ncbi:hypothetical protein NM688_g6926 [Phlebia brevispora]|uniref:Uncharacterized protein n=1 Tax=Phlebia brevispora TaxID=194682 RepID=A0ACC1SB48_9APHY|nr:hypothetical protein NM688_g6926 [Phlebia brevispora]
MPAIELDPTFALDPFFNLRFDTRSPVGEYDYLQIIQTSTATVEIEVPRNWRLWSGWPTDRVWEEVLREWHVKTDPMDQEGFDGDAAFPTFKPDADVFHVGLPNYSRRQRGWYSVRPWPPLKFMSMSADGSGPPAAGANLPPELFDLIMSSIRLDYKISPSCPVRMNKQELGRVALVCRRWASFFQRQIFETISLRSSQDLDALSSFLRHPKSRIVEYIQHIIISQSQAQRPCPPWTHRVIATCRSKLPELHSTIMVLAGPSSMGYYPRSICEMLPRSAPWRFTGIQHLVLDGLHFPKLERFIRVPRELPSLSEVTCINVTWNRSDDEGVPPISSYLTWSAQRHIKYTLSMCTDNVAAAWFAAALTPRMQDRLHEVDAHQIYAVASALVRHIDMARYPFHRVVSYRNLAEGSLGFHAFYQPFMTRLTPSVQFHLLPLVPRQARRVKAITVDFEDMPLSEMLDHTDWAMIDALAATMSTLETLLVHTHTPATLLVFHKHVLAERMPTFARSAKLRYAISVPKGYSRVVCSEDKVCAVGNPVKSWTELL